MYVLPDNAERATALWQHSFCRSYNPPNRSAPRAASGVSWAEGSATLGGCNAIEATPVTTPSLQAKKAYCAKTRQSNYAASLRLEGYATTPADGKRKLPTRESVLATYQQA